jgi:ribose transport system ATP-binding protein
MDASPLRMVPVIAAQRLAKRYGPVTALEDASISCGAGEVHALLGANGAGKSTFVKILSGVIRPDAGGIMLEGEPLQFTSPAHAAQRGIATVFQELSLFPQLTVAQNVLAGREPLNRLGLVDPGTRRARVHNLLERLGIGHLRPDQQVAELSLADRQIVEICKALSHDPRVLMLDEGTSALAHQEVRKLFSLLATLKARGLAVIFISHRMPEIREVADRVTVLRDGRDVLSAPVRDVDDERLIDTMLGRHLAHAPRGVRPLPAAEAPLLAVRGLHVPGRLRDVSFTLRRGEVFGVTGLDGQGQAELLWALFGGFRTLGGAVTMNGGPVRLTAPWRAMRAGIALIPPERKTAGLILPLSISRNIVLPSLSQFSRFGLLLGGVERQTAEDLARRLEIKAESVEVAAGTLSGGNQQKVVLAKWLAAGSDLFLLHDPTRGVDLGAKEAFGRLLGELAAAGKSAILYSTEVEELIAHCHRVAVMDRGRIIIVLEGADISEANILRATLNLADAMQGERVV